MDDQDKPVAGECCFCGGPVYYSYKEHETLDNAGTISISFGYGSRRDTDCGQGYIHDLCSAKLERLFSKRLLWTSPLSDALLDLETTIKQGIVTYEDRSE